MYVRLAFAVAANLDPEILIVDEVLAVGDAQFQRKCLGKMKDVASDFGRTVLLVSHNMASIATLAEKCLLLERGRVLAYGPTDEVIDQYMAQFGQIDSLEPGQFIPQPEPGKSWVVKSVEIFSQARRTDTIRMGDDLSLVVNLDFEAERIPESLAVGFGIETLTGVRVVSAGSLQAGFQIEPTRGRFVVRCNLGEIPLNQGQYQVRVTIADGYGHPLEVHESLGLIHVVPADVLGHGSILTASQGFFVWRSDWSQQDSEQVQTSEVSCHAES